jgi:hypothetical protein
MSRIWLVGSGPSLAKQDLNLLADEDVMVMNKFGRMAEHHGWNIRPKYYFKVDHNTVDMSHIEEIGWGYRNCEQLFLWEMFRDGYPDGHPNKETLPDGVGHISATWIKKCSDSVYMAGNSKAPTEWHEGLCTAFTGMSTMIQIANQLGYDEIILLGCDLDYTDNVNDNHAIPNYTTDNRDKSVMDNTNMLAAHVMASKCSAAQIYNASGGVLDVHPCVDILEVL